MIAQRKIEHFATSIAKAGIMYGIVVVVAMLTCWTND